MIGLLTGTVLSKTPTEVCVFVQGVGYLVNIPLSTSEQIGGSGSQITLHTYLHVREDVLQLYGFSETDEREMFKLLISVSGIGPRMALAVLSGAPVDSLRRHLANGDISALTTVPGIGRKLAERLVTELRDKAGKTSFPGRQDVQGEKAGNGMRSEATLALTSLGYSRPAAEKAVDAALAGLSGTELTIETVIKMALRSPGR